MATAIDRAASFEQAVGQWLRGARTKAELSMEDAGILADLTAEQVAEIEAGHASITGADFYALIAAYEVPLTAVNEFLESYGLKAASV